MGELGGKTQIAAELVDVYEDRNLLTLLLLHEWGTLGGEAWTVIDPAEPGWPVVVFEILGEQAGYHVPQRLVEQWPEWATLHHCDETQDCWPGHKWDGHTTAEKRQRIREYLHIAPA